MAAQVKQKQKSDKKWRKSLDIGSECEVYSRSDDRWMSAVTIKVFRDEKNKEWIKIRYGMPTKTKELKRRSKSLRAIPIGKVSIKRNKKRSSDKKANEIEIRQRKKQKLNEKTDASQISEIEEHKMHKKKPFKCQEPGCGRSFGNKHTLIGHAAVHSKKRPFECEKCGMKFKLASQLYNHKQKVHAKVINYKCEWEGCGKGFYYKTNLTVHTRVHTGEKPFECDICYRRFARKGDMMTHHAICLTKTCQRSQLANKNPPQTEKLVGKPV